MSWGVPVSSKPIKTKGSESTDYYNMPTLDCVTPLPTPPWEGCGVRFNKIMHGFLIDMFQASLPDNSVVTSPPEGVARYCFHPVCLCVCLSVCVCMCVSVCPANILVFYFSAIRSDIDLKFIQDTYMVVLNSLK